MKIKDCIKSLTFSEIILYLLLATILPLLEWNGVSFVSIIVTILVLIYTIIFAPIYFITYVWRKKFKALLPLFKGILMLLYMLSVVATVYRHYEEKVFNEKYNDYMEVVNIFKSGSWPYEVIETTAEEKSRGHYDKYVLPTKYHHLAKPYWVNNPKRKLHVIEGNIANPNSEIEFSVESHYDEAWVVYTPIKGCGIYQPCKKDHWYLLHTPR